MKRFRTSLIFIALIAAISVVSCEKLAEEDTPVCKDCWTIKYQNQTNLPFDTTYHERHCGGDVILWENIPDSLNADTTIKYFCN
jgi:hypothetical protein